MRLNTTREILDDLQTIAADKPREEVTSPRVNCIPAFSPSLRHQILRDLQTFAQTICGAYLRIRNGNIPSSPHLQALPSGRGSCSSATTAQHACHPRTRLKKEDTSPHARPRPDPRRPVRRETSRRVQGCETHRRFAWSGPTLLQRMRKIL